MGVVKLSEYRSRREARMSVEAWHAGYSEGREVWRAYVREALTVIVWVLAGFVALFAWWVM